MQQDPSQPTPQQPSQYYPSQQNWQPTPPPPPQNWQPTPTPQAAPYQYPAPSPYQYPAPPPKKPTPWLWIIGIVLVVLIGGGVVAAAVNNKPPQTIVSATTTAQGQPTTQSQPTTAPQATSAPQPTTASTGSSTGHKVGEVVAIGGWTITVNGVTTSTGDDFDKPKAGNTFVLIDITAVNTTGQSQTFSSLLSFTVKDSTGQTYDQTFVPNSPNSPDGAVTSGSKLRGTIAYEIPTSAHTLELDFTPGFASTDVATWNLTV